MEHMCKFRRRQDIRNKEQLPLKGCLRSAKEKGTPNPNSSSSLDVHGSFHKRHIGTDFIELIFLVNVFVPGDFVNEKKSLHRLFDLRGEECLWGAIGKLKFLLI